MSNQIRITVEQMHTRVSQYRAEAENVNSVITTMDNLLNELQSEWEGAASESYAQRRRRRHNPPKAPRPQAPASHPSQDAVPKGSHS